LDLKYKLYTYKGIVDRVIDADTFDIIVDLGFQIKMKQRFRLARIDAWEIRGEERHVGLKAKAYVQDLVEGKEVILFSEKEGSFGRYIAEVWVDGINVGDNLLAEGHAELYKK